MSRLSHWDALRRDSGNVLHVTRSSDEQSDSPELKRPQPVAPPEITTAHVDEAVEISLNEHVRDPGTQDAVKRLMQIDPNSAAAHAYYTSQAAQARMRAVPNTARKGVSIPHVLSDDAVKVVTEYAPEFKVNFSSNVSHDHPLAAATRILDHELVYARIPPGVTVGDIGGNPLFHVRRGIEDVHVCGPKYDRKDASRHLQRYMRVRQMLRDGSLSDVSAKLAEQYLEQHATKFACGRLAEHCHEQATVLTSIHVYDIALESWPLIMDNKNARVVEGVMLFSSRMFERKNGEFPSAGARYEVDMDQDKFRLGFVDSSAWWYEHNLTQYLKYGADQLISYQGQCYSYKIVERRGDTIFFRILKVPSVPYPEYSQYYMMPDIQTVEVRSFALTRQSAKYKKTRTVLNTYYKPIWDELYSQAANDIERGVFDLARVANHYRTVIVRSTINSVVVSGGMTADFGEETQMMVDVSLAAMADIYLGQRETLAMTRTIEAHRGLRSEATLTKVFSALIDTVKGLGFVLVLPFVALARFVDAAAGKVLSEHVVEWSPEVMIKRINVRHIMNAKNLRSIMREQSYDTWAKEYGDTYAPLDHVAAAKRSPHIMGLLQQVCPELAKETGATTSQSPEPAVAQSVGVPPPSYHTRSQAVVPSHDEGNLLELTDEQREERHTVRLAAVKEAIVEAEMESVATSSSCARAYREMAPNGKPVKALIEKYGEQYGASDFWYVENGIFERSFLGLKPDDYRHAAAYHPIPQADTTRCERVAYRRSYKAKVDDRLEVREYLLLDEQDFTGWLFTCDLLLIFNGPEILATLRKSLKVRHDYDIHLYQGPPGCGKTYQIIQKFDPKQPHGLFCPVRESIQDTRGQVQKKWGKVSDLKVRARTVDSFLVNWQSQDVTRNLSLSTAFFDECFMTSYGKAAALFGLLGVEHVHAYGDRFQIPHIPRVQAPSLYVRMRADVTHTEYVTRRCPADAVAAWGDIYEWRVRTASTVSESMKVVTSTEGLTVPKGCVMMAMYQADKVVLRSRYAKLVKTGAVTVDSVEEQVTDISQRVAKVLTAHEAEGKTYDDVWLHRFDARQRNDGRSLFDRQEHVLVAMSRHRNSFVYVCPAGVTDMIKRRIAQGSDVRRIEAAADLTTAGESLEKL